MSQFLEKSGFLKKNPKNFEKFFEKFLKNFSKIFQE